MADSARQPQTVCDVASAGWAQLIHSVAFGQRLAEAGIHALIGAVGSSSFDDALAETSDRLYETELIKPRQPWRTLERGRNRHAEWIDWVNHRRPLRVCGDIPLGLEDADHGHQQAQHPAERSIR